MTAASRYAKALFDLSVEHKQQSAVTVAVQALATALEDESVAASLAHARLSAAQRTQLATSMAKAVQAPQMLANTLGLLAQNNRLALVSQVLEQYLLCNDAASGITRVDVTSAAPLTDAQRDQISKLIKAHTKAADVRLHEKHDASLKGGFRAMFNGMVWDASLSGRLSRMATTLRAAITQRHSQI